MKYFFSYFYKQAERNLLGMKTNTQIGFGSCILHYENPIHSYQEIENIENIIRNDQNFENVVILFYKEIKEL